MYRRHCTHQLGYILGESSFTFIFGCLTHILCTVNCEKTIHTVLLIAILQTALPVTTAQNTVEAHAQRHTKYKHEGKASPKTHRQARTYALETMKDHDKLTCQLTPRGAVSSFFCLLSHLLCPLIKMYYWQEACFVNIIRVLYCHRNQCCFDSTHQTEKKKKKDYNAERRYC